MTCATAAEIGTTPASRLSLEKRIPKGDATIAATRITVRNSTSTTAPPPAVRIELTADATPFPISFTVWTATLPNFLEALPPLCADS